MLIDDNKWLKDQVSKLKQENKSLKEFEDSHLKQFEKL